MAYRINYALIGPDRHTNSKKKNGVIVASLIIVALALVVAAKAWSQPWVQRIFLPGDATVTASALEAFADNLRHGESFLDAVTVFCRSVLANGA